MSLDMYKKMSSVIFNDFIALDTYILTIYKIYRTSVKNDSFQPLQNGAANYNQFLNCQSRRWPKYVILFSVRLNISKQILTAKMRFCPVYNGHVNCKRDKYILYISLQESFISFSLNLKRLYDFIDKREVLLSIYLCQQSNINLEDAVITFTATLMTRH